MAFPVICLQRGRQAFREGRCFGVALGRGRARAAAGTHLAVLHPGSGRETGGNPVQILWRIPTEPWFLSRLIMLNMNGWDVDDTLW